MRALSRHIQVLVVAVVGLAGSCAMAADPDHGSDLARRWCAACHVVDPDQKQANTDAPPFAFIARKTDFTPEKVAPSCSTRIRKCRIFR